MNLSKLSIERPVFMTCVLAMLMVLGLTSLRNIPLDLFPDVTFPVVAVTTIYPGAGPKEIETSVSKILEEEMGTISGVKSITSSNKEGVSVVVAEFSLETDIKYAEQQVRDKVAFAKAKFPDDVKEPVIRRVEPSATPIMMMSLKSNLPDGQLTDLADEIIKPRLEQAPGVGLVEILGGRKREIHVELDRAKLNQANVAVSTVADRLEIAGQNIPAGTVTRDQAGKDIVFRTVGEFESVNAIANATVNFLGNDVPIAIRDLGEVRDTLEDPKNYAFENGSKTLVLYIYKQSGFNTVAASDNAQKVMAKVNADLAGQFKEDPPQLNLVVDNSRFIKLNVLDVSESIIIGIILTILVVYFFLGNMRSTLITGIAIPVSLIGAFFLISLAGFSFNVMSLMAFSLAVGLLIDDAIVVRENIFRHMELGKSPKVAALEGTLEVQMAVIAVTATIVAVFGPIGFLSGVVGQFFKQFGLSVCFIMIISLFDALTNAPMMSAYFGGGTHSHKEPKGLMRFLTMPVRAFDRLQTRIENGYADLLKRVLKRPWLALIGTVAIAASSCVPLSKVPKTFLPTDDNGEFGIGLDMPPGTSLERMRDRAMEVDTAIKKNPAVVKTLLVVGNSTGEKNKAEFYVILKTFAERNGLTTSKVRQELRESLNVEFADLNPKVKDIDFVGGGQRPFTLNIIGQNLDQVQEVAGKVFERLKTHPALTDVDISYRPGKPEFQVQVDLQNAQRLGVTSSMVGRELRAQVEGLLPAIYRENGNEYDIRVRLKPEQRDLEAAYNNILVPNLNGRMVSLASVAKPIVTTGPATIDRQNRGRYIKIEGDIAPDGPGMGGAINDINGWFASDLKLPEGMSYRFVGQAENFQELASSMIVAMGLGMVFIYLVLASLYESFLTPFTIMLVIPLAAVGAFFALYIGGGSLDLFSMIGCVMLMGLAVKNSIILVDYIQHLREKGMPEKEAIIEAGRVRFRPIVMTSLCLVAGMIPVAIGLNEVSNQRRGLGMAVIGGVISSTLLALVLIPAVYSYMEKLKRFIGKYASRLVTADDN